MSMENLCDLIDDDRVTDALDLVIGADDAHPCEERAQLRNMIQHLWIVTHEADGRVMEAIDDPANMGEALQNWSVWCVVATHESCRLVAAVAILPWMVRLVDAGHWHAGALVPMLHEWSAHDELACAVAEALPIVAANLSQLAAVGCLEAACDTLLRTSGKVARTYAIVDAYEARVLRAVMRELLLTRRPETGHALCGVLFRFKLWSAQRFSVLGVHACMARLRDVADWDADPVCLPIAALLWHHGSLHPAHRRHVVSIGWALACQRAFPKASWPLVMLAVRPYPCISMSRAEEDAVLATTHESPSWRLVRTHLKSARATSDEPAVVCKLTGRPCLRPVVASDGYTYERDALQALFERSALPRSPWTGEGLRKWFVRNLAIA